MIQPWITLSRVWLGHCLFGSLAYLCLMTIAPWVFVHAVGLVGSGTAAVDRQLFLTYCVVTWLAVSTIALLPMEAMGKGSRIKLLPVSSRMLAGFQYLMTTGLAAGLVWLSLAGLQLLFGIDWPLIPTILAMTNLVPLVMALRDWLKQPTLLRLAVSSGLTAVSVGWYWNRFYPEGFRGSLQLWATPDAADWLIWLVLFAISWQLSLLAFHSNRSGLTHACWNLEWAVGRGAFLSGSRDVVSGKSFTVLLLLFRRRGIWLSVGLATLTCLIMLLPVSDAWFRHTEIGRQLLIVPFLCAICGVQTGVLVLSEWCLTGQAGRMKLWVATLPFSNRQLSRALLQAVIRNLGLVLGLVLGIFGLVLLISRWTQHTLQPGGALQLMLPQEIVLLPVPVHWAVLGLVSLAMAWVGCGLGAVLAGSGRRWTLMAAVLSGSVISVAMVYLHEFGGAAGMATARAGLQTAGAAAVAATIYALIRVRQRALLTETETWTCTAALLILSAAAALLPWAQLHLRFVAVGVAALLVLPLVTFPLVISWNRQR